MKAMILGLAAATLVGLAVPASAAPMAPAGGLVAPGNGIDTVQYRERRVVRGPRCRTVVTKRRGPFGRVVIDRRRTCF